MLHCRRRVLQASVHVETAVVPNAVLSALTPMLVDSISVTIKGTATRHISGRRELRRWLGKSNILSNVLWEALFGRMRGMSAIEGIESECDEAQCRKTKCRTKGILTSPSDGKDRGRQTHIPSAKRPFLSMQLCNTPPTQDV